MSEHSFQHIEIQAFDLYERIAQIHRQVLVSPENLRTGYIVLHRILEQACYELTRDASISFANLFSRLDYICRVKGFPPGDKYAIQTMRRNCNAVINKSIAPDFETYSYDLRALLYFISCSFNEDIPENLADKIPQSNRPIPSKHQTFIPYIRASVNSWDETKIFASADTDDASFIVIDYTKGTHNGDLCYIRELLTENLPINLLNVQTDDNGYYVPELIIIHPDYLIDISSLAACFREYGHHPYNYFINKIKPRANTSPILMGNLAGQFLDDYINEQDEDPVTYHKTIKKFFASSLLEFCTCPIPPDFHKQAQAQMDNIRSFIRHILPENIPNFERNQTLLEASFVCEKLGLQGRVDMLQKDFKVLIEQKSGKRDEFHHRHKEDHFVQMMLYQGILMYNFGNKTKDLQTFLLYSKYPDGLIMERFAETLFRDSIRLRNYIVANEIAFGEGAVNSVINNLNTDLLNEKKINNRLWNDFQKPQLQETIDAFKRCSHLERTYFNRLFTFISKEQILNKTGGKNNPSHGFSGLWHQPLSEKIESGNILTNLKIYSKQRSHPAKGYDILELSLPHQEKDLLPNFRAGDIIIFYPCSDVPDIRKEILMKGNILSIEADRISIILRNGQQNKDIIGGENERFAIEHDYSDTSTNNAMRGLYAFLSATQERKDLLLGIRQPKRNAERQLNGHYGSFNELILKEKQADDYFLLVGPPGSGKTSCALRYLVEEALTDPEASLLLLSYTNRAVDEICDMLVCSGIAEKTPFVRIGNEYSCDKRFVPFLLKNLYSQQNKLTELKNILIRTRIYVGTTTSLNNHLYLFGLKSFSTAFIDEASQILEPELLGILSTKKGGESAVKKFVLVGDYKQLPAIALQSESEARVHESILNDIGLYDCRNSLFERLYKQSDANFRSILRKQGRMHPELAEFPNQTFYSQEQLEPVPLPHQQEDFPYHNQALNKTESLLLKRRLIFIPSGTIDETDIASDKTNPAEARIVAMLLKSIYKLSSPDFKPDKTVGVIVPFRNQIAMIRKEIMRLEIPELQQISIDTVERYQGSQRDVIIYSFTVRNFNQLNFLTENTFREGNSIIDRKLNVAITRARKQLILTGNPQILENNLTFYKLMEFIRMKNGYIETTDASFLKGDFNIPSSERSPEIQNNIYALNDKFRERFHEIIEQPLLKNETVRKDAHAKNLETIAYGRYDFASPDNENADLSQTDKARLYDYYYMCRQYAAAHALFESQGYRLFPAPLQNSARTIFCDFAYETGASAIAFKETYSKFSQHRLMFIGIYPAKEMQKTAKQFLSNGTFCPEDIRFVYTPSELFSLFRALQVTDRETVYLNMSNLFDRITPQQAKNIAGNINNLIGSYPKNRYILIYRNDTERGTESHSYKTFCHSLCKSMQPINEQMPSEGRFYYDKNCTDMPGYDTFIYEIRMN